LIFDMDGLLVDSEPLAEAAMTAFLRRYGHEPRAEVGERLLGRRLPEALAIVREAYELGLPIEELIAVYGEMRLEALRGNVRPMPGAAEIIAFGRAGGLRLALATSGHRSHADLSLGETGLAGLFDAEATGDDVELGKPAPDLFLLAASRVGVDPAACVVFEDAPLGVVAAVAAGMRVAAVPNAKSRELPFPVRPTVLLPDLTAAIAWLREQGVEGDRGEGWAGSPHVN
jgi:HAD superfamily hydrolase (TIGR01509 family)